MLKQTLLKFGDFHSLDSFMFAKLNHVTGNHQLRRIRQNRELSISRLFVQLLVYPLKQNTRSFASIRATSRVAKDQRSRLCTTGIGRITQVSRYYLICKTDFLSAKVFLPVTFNERTWQKVGVRARHAPILPRFASSSTYTQPDI